MQWIILFITAALMLLRLTVQLDAGKESSIELGLTIRLGPFLLKRHLRLIRTGNGHQLVRQSRNGTLQPIPAQALHSKRSDAVMRALAQCTPARQLLLQNAKLHELRGHVCLGGMDAARTALLVQAFRTACRLLPQAWRTAAQLQILPAFFSGHSSFRLRCIVSWPLGILVITSGMLAAKIFMQHSFRAKEAA